MELWEWTNFNSLNIKNNLVRKFDNWKWRFSLINLELFIHLVLNNQTNKEDILTNLLSTKGKELLI